MNLSKEEILEESLKIGDLFLSNLITNNLKECQEYFYNLFVNISNNLTHFKNNKTEILDCILIEKTIKCITCLKGTKINCFEK